MACLHLYVAERWRSRTSPGYNCEAAHQTHRKRRLFSTRQWHSAFLLMGLPVIHGWLKMGSQLSLSLIQLG